MKNKVLIVDDEPNIVMTLEYAFRKQNFEVYIARDGSEAKKIMEEALPQVVLLDIMMPKVDGYQTLAFIKQTSELKHTKVVFISAKNKASDIEKGLKMGADKYITKPFSVKKVIGEVKQLLD